MKNWKLVSEPKYLRAIVILPIIGLLIFTGFANLAGTAGRQTVTTRQAAATILLIREDSNVHAIDRFWIEARQRRLYKVGVRKTIGVG
jgi:hypothetical protein